VFPRQGCPILEPAARDQLVILGWSGWDRVTVDPIPKALIFCMRPRTVLEARMKNPTPDMAAVGRTGADSESP
jgi:hypothetical protein